MREYYIVILDGKIVRCGVVPEGMAASQPVENGEELRVVSREEYRASQVETQR